MFDNPQIAQEYARWIREAGPDHYEGADRVGLHEVLRAHFTILDYFALGRGDGVGGAGPRDLNLLHSAVSRQQVSFGEMVKYRDRFEIVGTLFYGLIQNHPFHDANKRTALLVALRHLLKIGRVPHVRQHELELLALRTASHSLPEYVSYEKYAKAEDPDVAFLAGYLRRITRDVDTHNYAITFQQLDTTLGRFGFQLDNPHGNHIDIVRFVEERRLFGRKKIVRKFVCQVGFPGMKAQVGTAALRTIRRQTALTPEYGIDAQVFFKDADPLPGLVAQYDAPLRRLARK